MLGQGLIAGALVLCATTLLRLGLRTLFQQLRARSRWVKLSGVVVRVNTKLVSYLGHRRLLSRISTERAHFPVIQFYTPAGESITFTSELGDSGKTSQYRPGLKVDLLYDPTGELPPMLSSWAARWFLPLAMIVGGLIFAALSLPLAIPLLVELEALRPLW